MAEKEFDAFLTTDKGIPHQQNLAHLDLTIVLPRAKTIMSPQGGLDRSTHHPALLSSVARS